MHYFTVQTLLGMSGVGFPWQGCTYTCILKTLSTFASNWLLMHRHLIGCRHCASGAVSEIQTLIKQPNNIKTKFSRINLLRQGRILTWDWCCHTNIDEFSVLCCSWVLVTWAYSICKQALCSGLRFLQMSRCHFPLKRVRDNWVTKPTVWKLLFFEHSCML